MRQTSFFESTSPNKFFGAATETIYRKCNECAKEEQVQRKTGIHNTVSAPATPTTPFLNSLNHSGNSLSSGEQHFFGQRMNHDFGEVKIHTNDEAIQSASSVNAQAYTYKNHIVFNKEKYQPSTQDGKKLLGHELAHVIQQSSAEKVYKQQQGESEWIPPDVGPQYHNSKQIPNGYLPTQVPV